MNTTRSWLTLAASVILVLTLTMGAARLSINSDTRAFFSENSQLRERLNQFEAKYDAKTNLMIVLHADTGDVFTPERLDIIRQLTEDAWRLPYAVRVDSVTNAVHISSNDEGISIEDLSPQPEPEISLESSAAHAENARERALNDNILQGLLIAPDAKTTAINIVFNYELSDSTATGDILDAAKAMAEKHGVTSVGFDVWYGGRVATSSAFAVASKTDMKTLTPLSYVAIFVLVGVLIRSWSVALALTIPVIFAVLSALGLAGWIGVQLNAATASAPTIILTLGVAALLHIATLYQKQLQNGMAKNEAIATAMNRSRMPVTITLATTALGFLTLNFADGPPFRELGNIVAAGALLCLVFGLGTMPAILSLLPARAPSGVLPGDKIAALAARIVTQRSGLLLRTAPFVVTAMLAGVFFIEINDNYVKFFDQRYEFRRHADLIQENLTGLEVVDFDIGSEENAVLNPAYFNKIDQFETWLKGHPKVVYTSSISETFKRLNQHMNDGAVEHHIIPNDSATLAQYMLLYEMSLPFGRTLNDTVSIDKSHSRVFAVMRDASSKDLRALQQKGEAWLRETAPTHIAGAGTGLSVMFAYLSSLNIQSMIGGTLAALALISIVLMVAFRSVKYGLISLVPNLLPVLIAFGAWGYLVGKVGVAISAVGALTLGIIVDDTVHLLWRYLEARRAGKDATASVHTMFSDVGRPMMISTLVLATGFLLLATSGFHITNGIGALSTMIICTALITDWFLLPPLLLAIDQKARIAQTSQSANPFRPEGYATSATSEKERQVA